MASSRKRGSATTDPGNDIGRFIGLRQNYRAEFEKLLKERSNELLSVQMGRGPRSDRYQTLHRELDRTEAQFSRIDAVIRRPVNKMALKPWMFWTFAICLAILEAPVNKFLFDFAIQGTNLTSYVISIGVAILLLILAHLAGRCLRQAWSEYRRRIVWSNLIVFAFAAVVLLASVCILTVGRAAFSAGSTNQNLQDIFGHVGGQVSQMGVMGTLFSAFSDVSALILFTVNLGAIVASMLLGFFSHDPDKDYDHADIALSRCKKEMDLLERAYAKERGKLIRRYSPDLAGVSRNYAETNTRVIELKSLLGQPVDDSDRFILESLDRLSDEASENEDRFHEEATSTAEAVSPEPGSARPAPRLRTIE